VPRRTPRSKEESFPSPNNRSVHDDDDDAAAVVIISVA